MRKTINIFKSNILNLTCIAMILAATFPTIIAALNAVFICDDFSYYVPNSGVQRFIGAWQMFYHAYKSWEGRYSCVLITVLCNPLNWYSFPLLRGILAGLVLLFVLGIVYTVRGLLKKYHALSLNYSLIFAVLIIMPFFSYHHYYDVFWWYTGAISYLFPIDCILWGFAVLLHGKSKTAWIIVSAVLFVLANGCSLTVAGFGCAVLLVYNLYEFVSTGHINRTGIIVFICSFLGALTNAAAPGNFARANGVMNLFSAGFFTLKCTIQEIKWFCFDTTFFIYLIAAFLCGVRIKHNLSTRNLLVVSVGAIFIPLVTTFPVVLGYSAASIEQFGSRTLFTLDLSIILCSVFFFIILGSKLSAMNFLPEIKSTYFTCAVLTVCVLMLNKGFITNTVYFKVMHNISKGIVQEYADGWETAFDQIKQSDQNDVVITQNLYGSFGCCNSYYEEDSSFYVNSSIASYFHKSSVSFAGTYEYELE